MTFLFVVRNRDNEDHGEVVPALVLNIIVASLNAILFVSSTSVAWLRRKKDPTSVKVFYYGSLASSAGLSTILFTYRASHRVAALGGSVWIAAGEALTWILFQSIWIQAYSWRMAKVCNRKKGDISSGLLGTLCFFGVVQTVLVITWLCLLWKHTNPVHGSILLVATVLFGAAKDLVVVRSLRAKLQAVSGKMKMRTLPTPLPGTKSGSNKVIPSNTGHALSSQGHSTTAILQSPRPRDALPASPRSDDGEAPGIPRGIEHRRGGISTEEAMKMLNDSLGQFQMVVAQMLVFSVVIVTVPALAHRPFILFAYMHAMRCGGGLSALLVLDIRNLREARDSVTQKAVSSFRNMRPSNTHKAHTGGGSLPYDATMSANNPSATP